jgi:hypothetical protein
MKRVKQYIEKESDVKYLIVSIFILSILARTVLGILFGQMNVFYDELLHWNISKSIHYDLSTNFRNSIINYNEILYSIFVSISHFYGNAETQYYIAVGINSIIMSSVIFPVYFMSNKFLNNKFRSVVISFISIILPEMFYTSKILQENLFYPMAIWFFYIFIKMIKYDQYSKKNVMLLSIYTFLISICKQIALNIFIGVLLYYILQLFIDKENRKRCIKSILLFVFIFFIFKLTYNKLFAFIYDIEITSTSSNAIITIIKNIFDIKLLMKLIFPAITYTMSSILYSGFFTVLLPLSYIKICNKYERNLLLIILMLFVSTVAVICLSIVPYENPDQVNIRIHIRYLFYLIIPILIVFFSIYDRVKNFDKINISLISALFVICLYYVNVIPPYSLIDCMPSYHLSYFIQSDVIKYTLYLFIIVFIFLSLYLLYKNKIKFLYITIIICLMINGVLSNGFAYYISNRVKLVSVYDKEDALSLNKYFNENITNRSDKVLIISGTAISNGTLELYLEIPYYFCLIEDFNNMFYDSSFDKLNLTSFNFQFKDKNLPYPKYIITNTPLFIQGYDNVNINLNKYYLYIKNNEEFSIDSFILNRYDDCWIGREANIKIKGDNSSNVEEITLQIDSPNLDGVQLKIIDSTGTEQIININQTTTDYNIQVNKNGGEDYYNITLLTNNTFVPGGNDLRELSVRIFDIKLK